MRGTKRWGLLAVAIALLAVIALGGWKYAGKGRDALSFIETGTASWYGPAFNGKKTASGEPYDQNELTAAHKKLPLGSQVTVTNLETGKAVNVEINDRGPYVPGRKIDLSIDRPDPDTSSAAHCRPAVSRTTAPSGSATR